MGSLLVVPTDPVPDRPPGLREILKQMLPHALLLQAPEEALVHAVLLGSVGGDEFLAETVVSKRGDAGFFRSPRPRGRGRRAFSAAESNFSRQSSTLATVRPCLRAAFCTEVSPRMMLTINAERLLAVQRWTSSGSSSVAITTSRHDFTMAY